MQARGINLGASQTDVAPFRTPVFTKMMIPAHAGIQGAGNGYRLSPV